MVFVKHTIRKSTNTLCPGDRWLVASIKAQHYSDADITDATADEVIAEGGTPPGENIMAFNGPVVVHGYSLRVFSDFFGLV